MRYICKLILLLVLSGATFIHAQDPLSARDTEAQQQVERFFKGDFSSQQGDKARRYLVTLFGELSTLGLQDVRNLDELSSNHVNNDLVPFLFKIFNLGILAISSTILVYSSVFSLSGAANEGGAIGSGRASGWVVGRVVTSFAVLVPVPNFNGYSMIQLLVLKIVLAGSAVANQAWVNVLSLTEDKGGGEALVMSLNEAKTYLPPMSDFFGIPSSKSPENIGSEDAPAHRYSIKNEGRGIEFNEEFIYYFNQLIADSLNVIVRCAPCICMSNTAGLAALNLDFQMIGRALYLNYTCDNVYKSVEFFRYDLDVASVQGTALENTDKKTVFEKMFVSTLNRYIINVTNDLKNYLVTGSISMIEDEELIKENVGRIISRRFGQFYRDFSTLIGSIKNVDQEVVYDAALARAKRDGWVHSGLNIEQLVSGRSAAGDELQKTDFLKKIFSNFSIDNKEVQFSDRLRKTSLLENELNDGEPNSTAVIQEFHRYMTAFLKSGLEDFIRNKQPESEAPLIDSVESLQLQYLEKLRTKLDGRDAKEIIGRNTGPMVFLGDDFNQNLIFEDMKELSSGVIDSLISQISQGAKDRTPIRMLQTIGQKIIGHTLHYYQHTIDEVPKQIEHATLVAYGVTSGLQAVVAIVKAYKAHNQNVSEDPTQDRTVRAKAQINAQFAGNTSTLAGSVEQVLSAVITITKAAATALVNMYLLIGNGLAIVYLTTGVILGAYVPFIPTLIFVFSVLAWLGSVIEALLASPIIAVGFANPDGHELLGKSEQSLMLLLGVFLRPLLTVIGLVVSVTVAQELAGVFVKVLLGVLPFFIENIPQITVIAIFAISGFCLLFSYSLMVILEQCYSLIYAIPDRVLKWIGGPQDMAGSSISQVLNSASGGLTSQSAKAAQGLSAKG